MERAFVFLDIAPGNADMQIVGAATREVRHRCEAEGIVIAAGPARLILCPPVVVPAERPAHRIAGKRIRQTKADATADEEGTERPFLLLQVGRIANHLVREGLFDLPEPEAAKRTDAGGDFEVRQTVLAGGARDVVLPSQLQADEVIDWVAKLETSTSHEPQRPQIPLILLLSDLRPALLVLDEPVVVHQRHNAERR